MQLICKLNKYKAKSHLGEFSSKNFNHQIRLTLSLQLHYPVFGIHEVKHERQAL